MLCVVIIEKFLMKHSDKTCVKRLQKNICVIQLYIFLEVLYVI